MLGKGIALSGAAVVYLLVLYRLARELRPAPLSWRILGWSAIPLSLGGLGFATRFWHPSPGPYVANSVYPFGGHLNAWAVSFGLTWLAFGLLFTGAVAYVWKRPGWLPWILLFSSWLLCLWPHIIIGIAFAWNGANQKSIDFYARWGSNPMGCFNLLSSSFVMLWYFSFSIVGFIGTARDVKSRGLTLPASPSAPPTAPPQPPEA